VRNLQNFVQFKLNYIFLTKVTFIHYTYIVILEKEAEIYYLTPGQLGGHSSFGDCLARYADSTTSGQP